MKARAALAEIEELLKAYDDDWAGEYDVRLLIDDIRAVLVRAAS